MTDYWNTQADAFYALLLNRTNDLVLFFTKDADWYRIRGAIQNHPIATRKAGELDAARAVLVAFLEREPAKLAGGVELYPTPQDFWERLAMDLYMAVASDVDNLIAFFLDRANTDDISRVITGSSLAELSPNALAASRAVLAARMDRSWDPGELEAFPGAQA